MCCKAIMLSKPMSHVLEIAERNDKDFPIPLEHNDQDENIIHILQDAQFIRSNWRSITCKEMILINPYLGKSLISHMISNMVDRKSAFPIELIDKSINDKLEWYCANRASLGHYATNMYFYTCSKHDAVSNECTTHTTRPRVCSEYPNYGNNEWDPKREQLYDENCGYKDYKSLVELAKLHASN